MGERPSGPVKGCFTKIMPSIWRQSRTHIIREVKAFLISELSIQYLIEGGTGVYWILEEEKTFERAPYIQRALKCLPYMKTLLAYINHKTWEHPVES
jgi:hypothetical protein